MLLRRVTPSQLAGLVASVVLAATSTWVLAAGKVGRPVAAVDMPAPPGLAGVGGGPGILPTPIGPAPAETTTTAPPVLPAPEPTTSTTAPPAREATGLLTFRGNASRRYYGQGPVPVAPEVIWRFPDQPMCSVSFVGSQAHQWCGTGWTGQPAVLERNGRTWVVFGAYDGALHFLDAATGRRLLPDFLTGDLIKGSVTVDPDGFPLVYTGSRDDNFRVVAIDRPVPTELWRLPADAVSPVLWNNDWDGTGLVAGGYLYEGGENGQFHVVRLNRSFGADGLVVVAPELVFHAPGWDDELLAALPDRNVSIESSVALSGGIAWFANSGGLVQGWDVSGLDAGREPRRVFRFWMGDDVDATLVIDDDGTLYAAAEWERRLARASQVGQIVRLDPRLPDPVVWSVDDRAPGRRPPGLAGVWATPALHRDLVVVASAGGRVMGIDRATGLVRWTKVLPDPVWQSPVVVDDVLVQGDCEGVLHGYDLSDTGADPPELWTVRLPGCIESTPAVWKGRIYVGTRDGFFYALGDP